MNSESDVGKEKKSLDQPPPPFVRITQSLPSSFATPVPDPQQNRGICHTGDDQGFSCPFDSLSKQTCAVRCDPCSEEMMLSHPDWCDIFYSGSFIVDLGGHLRDICLSLPLQTWKEVLVGSCPTSLYPSNSQSDFHRAVPCMGILIHHVPIMPSWLTIWPLPQSR